MDSNILKPEERAIFSLRSLYRNFGYLPFKMTRFEEYDLYAVNKDFLVSDSIITFNDTNGKLLALKPDVTLSIIKNYRDENNAVEKLYYNENVYRLSSGTHEYQEIPQSGVECIGKIDTYQILEVITLAAQSLAKLGDDYVLDLSDMDIISSLITESGAGDSYTAEIMRCLGEKNTHELEKICNNAGLSEENTAKITALTMLYGNIDEVINQLKPLCKGKLSSKALNELSVICGYLADTDEAKHIHLDFSIVNDMNYYNGFVFKGYLPEIPEGVLAGGQYDSLVEKMGKNAKGIGFAIYLDLIERYRTVTEPFDVDILLLYDNTATPKEINETVQKLSKNGKSVLASPGENTHLICQKKFKLQKGKVTEIE